MSQNVREILVLLLRQPLQILLSGSAEMHLLGDASSAVAGVVKGYARQTALRSAAWPT